MSNLEVVYRILSALSPAVETGTPGRILAFMPPVFLLSETLLVKGSTERQLLISSSK